MNNFYDDQARLAKNKQEIFNNRVKVIIFLITVGTGVATIWEKCSSFAHHTVTAADSTKRWAEDSAAAAHRVATITNPRRRHTKADTKISGGGGKTQDDDRTAGDGALA